MLMHGAIGCCGRGAPRSAVDEKLEEKMKAIKEAAVSQYGSRSPQHSQVRAIRV